MLSVSRRISSALDNFNARVHQKTRNGLEADVHLVRTCTPLSSYPYPYIKSTLHASYGKAQSYQNYKCGLEQSIVHKATNSAHE